MQNYLRYLNGSILVLQCVMCFSLFLLHRECVPGLCPSLRNNKASVTAAAGCSSNSALGTKHRSARSSAGISSPNMSSSATSADDIASSSDAHQQQQHREQEQQYCANTTIQTRNFPAVEVFLTEYPTAATTTAATATPSLATSVVSDCSSNNTKSSNASSARGRPPKVSGASKITASVSRGYGLRLLQPVRKGTIIIEYLGEVITAAEGLRRMNEYAVGDDFYFAGLEGGLMLDAKVMGSAARFANHSCSPTCLLQKWRVLGESRLVLVAKRNLPAGAEVR